MTLRVLVADDEAPARRKLIRLLGEHGDVELVGEAQNGVEAVELIAKTEPAVVFLDIRMPELDGIGVAESLARGERPPAIVFVTAFDHHAVKAFELSALDYLLKPYDAERFERALDRARRSLQGPAMPEGRLAELLGSLRNEERFARRILVPFEGRSIFVAVADVVRLESDGNNVLIRTRAGALSPKAGAYSMRATLDSLEARLDPQQFARVHRSHVVNIDEIAEVRPWFHGDQTLRLRDGTEIAWSRRYAAKRPDLLR